MRTWSFINQKGGSGKSTLCTQLAVHAVEAGEKVLILDVDPQGSAEAWHEKRGVDRHPGAMRCKPENLAKVIGGGGLYKLTLFFLDTAPHTNNDALTAIALSDLIICPTQASLFDLHSLEQTAHLLHNAGKADQARVVVNNVPPGTPKSEHATVQMAADIAKSYGLQTCSSYVCHRTAFIRTTNDGRGVTEASAIDQKASSEIRRLWLELNRVSPAIKATSRKRIEAPK